MDVLDSVSVPRIDFNYIFTKMYSFVTWFTPENISAFWHHWLPVIVPISILFSIACISGIVYANIRTGQIRTTTALELERAARAFSKEYGEVEEANGESGDEESARRWAHIQELIASSNENDWRAAIIEADTILEKLVDKMGYQGEGLGEQLKQIEKSDFTNLEAAWEAHKIRNRIAHDGSAYALTQRETHRIIGLYQKVFEEFFYL